MICCWPAWSLEFTPYDFYPWSLHLRLSFSFTHDSLLNRTTVMPHNISFGIYNSIFSG